MSLARRLETIERRSSSGTRPIVAVADEAEARRVTDPKAVIVLTGVPRSEDSIARAH